MRLLGMLICCFFIASCTTIAPPSEKPTTVAWDKRKTTLSHLTNWNLNGKIAVQTAQDSGSASIDWAQNRQQFSISLMGPLGSNGLKISGSPGNVTMQTSDGKSASASSPEKLLAQQWGWRLPVSNLNYWVRGLPVPGMSASTQFDAYHRVTDLSQGGWHVQYLSYTKAGGVELPQRMVIASSSFKAKMMIYNWNIH